MSSSQKAQSVLALEHIIFDEITTYQDSKELGIPQMEHMGLRWRAGVP